MTNGCLRPGGRAAYTTSREPCNGLHSPAYTTYLVVLQAMTKPPRPRGARREPSTAHRYSIAEVADAAGVSVATVSRTLQMPHVVASQTLERVKKAVAKLGYGPNAGARNATNRPFKRDCRDGARHLQPLFLRGHPRHRASRAPEPVLRSARRHPVQSSVRAGVRRSSGDQAGRWVNYLTASPATAPTPSLRTSHPSASTSTRPRRIAATSHPAWLRNARVTRERSREHSMSGP
jgi:hypothetical protein